MSPSQNITFLKAKFYAVAFRSAITIILLILFLILVPLADVLKNQEVVINSIHKTGVEVAKALISLVIVGVLLNFAYVSESQLPKITTYKHVGLIIASVIHIVVIFIAYYYLLPFARNQTGNVDQVFNTTFLILLCIPLYRGGMALYSILGTQPITEEADKILHNFSLQESVRSTAEKDTAKILKRLKVFLCHSSDDKLAVHELYQKLGTVSWINVWLDEEKLLPGQDWEYEIEKALDNSDAIIVSLSRGSVTKEGYVQRELRFVINIALEKPEGTIFILPVRLEECEPPRKLRTYQYADYFPAEQRERAFHRLLASLRMRAEELGIPDVD